MEDGGYVISDEVSRHSDVLISAGVGEDIRFEADFYKRYGCKGLLIDPFVSDKVAEESSASLVLRSKVAGGLGSPSEDSMTLEALIDKAEQVSGKSQPRLSLKMDIE